MTLQLLEQRDIDRLSRLLREYEAGRLNAPTMQQDLIPRAPIEHYVGKALQTIPASTGEPSCGLVEIVGDNNGTIFPEALTVEACSLWNVAVNQCKWVHLGRDPYSGTYFIISIPGTLQPGCSGSSGSGLLCCENPQVCVCVPDLNNGCQYTLFTLNLVNFNPPLWEDASGHVTLSCGRASYLQYSFYGYTLSVCKPSGQCDIYYLPGIGAWDCFSPLSLPWFTGTCGGIGTSAIVYAGPCNNGLVCGGGSGSGGCCDGHTPYPTLCFSLAATDTQACSCNFQDCTASLCLCQLFNQITLTRNLGVPACYFGGCGPICGTFAVQVYLRESTNGTWYADLYEVSLGIGNSLLATYTGGTWDCNSSLTLNFSQSYAGATLTCNWPATATITLNACSNPCACGSGGSGGSGSGTSGCQSGSGKYWCVGPNPGQDTGLCGSGYSSPWCINQNLLTNTNGVGYYVNAHVSWNAGGGNICYGIIVSGPYTQDGCCGACPSFTSNCIGTNCCDCVSPTLTCTYSTSACSCANAHSFILNYQGNNTWSGSATLCGQTYSVTIQCQGGANGVGGTWYLTQATCVDCSTPIPASNNVNCDPLFIPWNNLSMASTANCACPPCSGCLEIYVSN